MSIRAFCTGAALLGAASGAHADPGWSGEGALSAGVTTGNTETTDIGAGLKLAYEAGRWTHTGEVRFDYAEQDGLETKNRVVGAYQLNRDLTERLFAFARASHERDEFSGFDSRTFLGVGVGYTILDGAATTWSVKAAPGLKIDEVQPAPPAVVGGTEQSFAAVFGSTFAHAFNDHVSVGNDTEIIYADVSTQANNQTSLTAQIMERLSARLSFEVRYETDPALGRQDTDTATRFGLVYGF